MPRHFSRLRWGIYLKESGISRVAGYLLNELKRGTAPMLQANPVEAARFAAYYLYRHESFHFTTEMFACQVESQRMGAAYLPYDRIYRSQLNTSRCVEELLANYTAIANGQIGFLEATSAYFPMALTQPPGYRDAVALAQGRFRWNAEECFNILANHICNPGVSAPDPTGASGAFILPAGVQSVITSYSGVPSYLIRDQNGVYDKLLNVKNPRPIRFKFRSWP